MRMKALFAASLAMLLVALGCVIRTEHKIDAHITLDIRHIATQAENVLDFVEGKTDALPGLDPAAANTPAGPASLLRMAADLLNPIQVAHADTITVTTSPLVKEIAVKMRDRNAALEALKAKACLGESNRGYLELRDCDGLKEAGERNDAQKLLAEENKDRKALYNEITRLNTEQKISVSTVESIYALERLRRGKAGEVFQLPAAGPDFDTVKQSALGQRLGANCTPGNWVTLP